MSRARKLLLLEQMCKQVSLVVGDKERNSSPVGVECRYALVEPHVGGVDIIFLDEKPQEAKEVVAKTPSYGIPLKSQDPIYVSLPSKVKKVKVEDDEDKTIWFDFETPRQKMVTVDSLPKAFEATLILPLGYLKEGEVTRWKDISTDEDLEGGNRLFKVSGEEAVEVHKCESKGEFPHTLGA